MMIMNIVFLKLIMSVMSQMAAGGVLVWLVFVVALTRVARKIDSHIGKIGLNPAPTGKNGGSTINQNGGQNGQPVNNAQNQTVYRTRTGSKYHRSGCSYLKSKIETTVDEAQAMGLEPCSSSPPR